MSFDGRAAIVTSGTDGIGLTVAEPLVADGTNVVLVARRLDRDARVVERPGADTTTFLGGIEEHLIDRTISPDEIADRVLWLLSSHAAMVTGAALPVDGESLVKTYPRYQARTLTI